MCGSEFYGSVVALQVLIWATSVMFVYRLMSSTYMQVEKEYKVKLSASAALLNIVLNLILIHSLSFTGASTAILYFTGRVDSDDRVLLKKFF